MKVVGRVLIGKMGVYVFYFIRIKEGEWWITNGNTLRPTHNIRHKKFNIARRFKYWATGIREITNKLQPFDVKTGWQKEWEVDDRLVIRMFGKDASPR